MEDSKQVLLKVPAAIEVMASITLDEPICCLMLPSQYSGLVIVGTYKLHNDTQKRTGSLQVLKVHDKSL